MSEYQYHEWQIIDRVLTEQEQEAVSRLSSHIEVSGSRAVVTYQWGDFKHDPKAVLAKYFDAYLYLANWGSRQLIFRFPKEVIDKQALIPYCVRDYFKVETKSDHLILDIDFREQEPDDEWIEGEGSLSSLARLREDILQGDYRLLYLAWLHAKMYFGFDDPKDELEPPVSAGLSKLTAPLQNFVDFVGLDPLMVKTAALASAPASPPLEIDFRPLLTRLSREECEDYLLRVIKGDGGVASSLKKQLRTYLPAAASPPASERRTVGQLAQAIDQYREEEKQRQAKAADTKKRREMEDLASREDQVWQEVETLIQTAKPKSYDGAVQLLTKLQQLAEYKASTPNFQLRLESLQKRYASRSGLKWRIQHNLGKS